MNIFVDNRLFITKTKNKGFGIFTNEFIPANTTIEISPVLKIKFENLRNKFKKIKIWCYDWNEKNSGLSNGFGPLYNHSFNPNVTMKYLKNKYFKFTTTKDIAKNEELFINYGSTWWNEPKTPEIKIKYSKENISNYIYISNLIKVKKNHFDNHVLQANENIKKGTVIEIARCLFFKTNKTKINKKNSLNEILFVQKNKNHILGFGYSNLYKINKNNFNVICYMKNKKLHFEAIENIKKGEILKISSKNVKN